MLYKSSDADNKPNLTVLSQLIEEHGKDSEEVHAFLNLYSNNKEFTSQAHQLMSSKLTEECKGEDE